MKWKWILPAVYVLWSAVLLVFFTEPGRRWENLWWFSITLPVSLLMLITETRAAMVAILVTATFQYWALGSYIDRGAQRNKPARLSVILPVLYVVASFILLFVFTGVGHGGGSEPWTWISLPVSLILLIGDMSASPSWLTGLINTPAGILVPFVASILQYWALGFFLDRRRRK